MRKLRIVPLTSETSLTVKELIKIHDCFKKIGFKLYLEPKITETNLVWRIIAIQNDKK